MTDAPAQRFSFGYHLITWDLAGESLNDALAFLAENGIQWFESLLGDSLGTDFARRRMSLGPVRLNPVVRDTDIFTRLALFARAEREHGLRIASLFASAEYINPNMWPYERDMMQTLARFLHGCGARILVCGGGPSQGTEARTAGDYRTFAMRLEEIGHYTDALGIRTVYHPHLDCFIENREQLDRLMDVLDTRVVGLCIDPTHLQISGSDPVDIVATYYDVVNYVHLKDCKGDVRALRGFDRYRSFCELGEGVVDLRGIIEILLQRGYDGIAMIELDYSEKGARESCRQSLDYVTRDLGLHLNAQTGEPAARTSAPASTP